MGVCAVCGASLKTVSVCAEMIDLVDLVVALTFRSA